MGCSFHTQPSAILPIDLNSYECKEKVTVFIGRPSSSKENNLSDLDKQHENIIEVKEPINGEGLILVERAISKHFLLYCLSQTERYELIKLMRRYSAGKNQVIFKKGDKACNFFIISSGKVLIETELKPIILEKGACFGELALIYEAPRSATIVSVEPTLMWGIEMDIFEKFMCRIKQKNSKNIKKFIDKLPFFAFMNEKQKESLGYNSHRFRYTMGSIIFSVRDLANSIFVVINGRIEMEIPNKPKVLFEKGEMFGEGCLLGDEYRSGTACAIEDTEVLSISKNALLYELKIETNNIIFYCICKWSLKRSTIFNLLKRTIIDKLIFRGQMLQAENDEILEKKGHKTNCLYICLEGKINGYPVGSIFNERPEESGKKDLVKMGKGHVFRIGFGELTEIINRPLGEFVETKYKNCGREICEEKDEKEVKEVGKREEIH